MQFLVNEYSEQRFFRKEYSKKTLKTKILKKNAFRGLTFNPISIRIIGKIGKGVIKSMAILNIKDFPDELHRKAKAEAALMGISLKELIIRAITEYLKKQKGR